MFKQNLSVVALLSGSALLTTAFALGYVGLPSAKVINDADRFQPPRIGAYATKLAQQPDMEGLWTAMRPENSGEAPVFDPIHTFYPPQLVAGEATFGPIPGTYIRDIPYNAEYRKKYRSLVKETTEGKSRDTFAACIPYGVPRMIGDSADGFDIIQAPEVMIWYDGYGRTERWIFLDGRKHPGPQDPYGAGEPSDSGHSVGRWEGNILVVDTVNMIGGYFDETPAPYSGKLHMVEHIRLIDTNILQDQMTFTDPVTMAKPWVVTRYFHRGGVPGSHQTGGRHQNRNDQPCVPNVKIDKDGFQEAILPQELDAGGKGLADRSP